MTDEQPRPSAPMDRDSRERVLVIILALAGLLMTLGMAVLPVIAGVPRGAVFGVVVGAGNAVGYLTMVAVATQSPLRWGLVHRAAWAVIGVSVIGAVWAVLASAGADFLLAMSGLMAAMVLVVSHLVRGR
ncbi:hypothetical protein GIY30_08180 [Gordonia sp. HNM0687]|uniref:Uncharacterized protein n=1 Tax=Gordonia mangrovi TaxID=2665643 RepID=A0A6L7GS09_9ACTN|nr:hypothetical protein [Gordonia mangrovi]MXP21328.1 hypothetical protein [Gordonia mangrovi]UVF80078.1 hypothetical protein NWF22_09755 [Gordonia mangrovi]